MRKGDRRGEILDLLAQTGNAMSVSEIADGIGLQARQTRIWLAQLEKDNAVVVEGGVAKTSPKRRYRRR